MSNSRSLHKTTDTRYEGAEASWRWAFGQIVQMKPRNSKLPSLLHSRTQYVEADDQVEREIFSAQKFHPTDGGLRKHDYSTL